VEIADEIERLSELRRRGIIDEAEFVAAKARLLSPGTNVATSRFAQLAQMDLADGRILMGAGSATMILALLLPWLDLILLRLSGLDLFRLAFGLDRSLRNLTELFGGEPAGPSGIRVAVSLLAILVLANIAAPLWRSPRARNRQALIGAMLLIGLTVFTALRAGGSPFEFFGVGAWLFLLALVFNQTVAATALVRGDVRIAPVPVSALPGRIVDSRHGRLVIALIAGPVLAVALLEWFLYPSQSSGPIVIEYELGTFAADGWAPQRAGEIAVRSDGRVHRATLAPPATTPSRATTTRTPAGRWTSGGSVIVRYTPSLSDETAQSYRLDRGDDAGEVTVQVPDQPSWRSRFTSQEMVVRISVEQVATLRVEHDDFGRLHSSRYQRVNEPRALEQARLERERVARIERQVRDSCRALEREWIGVFRTFNAAEEALYTREWGFQAVTRPYRDWARRAANMRNGLVAPYNATSSSGRNVRAAPVQGDTGEISRINDRARTQIAAKRRAIADYLDHWESVNRAARLESASLWRSREGEIDGLRTTARSGVRIDFGC